MPNFRSIVGRVITASAIAAVIVGLPAPATRAAGTPATQSSGRDELTRSLAPLPVTIRYARRYGRVAERVSDICREEIPRIAAELGLRKMAPIEIVVTPDARSYEASLQHEMPSWGIAFAILDQQRILVDVNRATRAYNSLDEVVPHELSHLLLDQRVPDVRFPIWFLEGLAQWQAREWSLVDSWQLMNTVWHGAPRLSAITWFYPAGEAQAQAAYRMSYAAFTELFNEVGFDKLPAFLTVVRGKRDFDAAFRSFWGFSVEEYDSYLRNDLEKRYHSNLLLFQDEPLFGFVAVLFLIVILRYYFRSRRRYREMEEQERRDQQPEGPV